MNTARRALITVGAAVMGYAVWAGVTGPGADPVGVLLFLGGVLVLHDAVLLPAAIGAGALIGRFVPAAGRVPVRVGALVAMALCVVAAPLVLGFGRVADNPSVLPLPYGRNLVLVLVVVAAAAAAGAVAMRRRRLKPDPARP